MNCANCGHEILSHAGTSGPAATVKNPCYYAKPTNETHHGWEACDCKDFVMPRDEPKPKLCACGHPATSHAPFHRIPDSRVSKYPFPVYERSGHVATLSGRCIENHDGIACGRFTAPEDVKRGPTHQLDMSTVRDTFEDVKGGNELPSDYDVFAEAGREVKKFTDHWVPRIDRLREERDAARAKVAELEAWKREAMSVMPDWQAIGKELGLEIGDTVHDKVLGALRNRAATITRLRSVMDYTAGIPETAARNELSAVRLFLGLKNGESILGELRRMFTGK